jgi:ABC-type bacteriocin/lantibiotic exporter with double-glycine peptidase domain
VGCRFVLCVLALAAGTCLASPAEPSASWIDVPYVKQQDNGCGAAVTAMVMQYWRGKGFAVPEQASDPQRIYRRLYSEQAKATLGSDIAGYLSAHGLEPHVFKAEWEDLAAHVEQGRPLIACVRNRGKGAPFHYVVVVGFDNAGAAILVNDPARRKLTRLGRVNFEAGWQEAGRWTLLAVPQRPQ